jgi:hypothetical protein
MTGVSVFILLAGLSAWVFSLRAINLRALDDLGLVSTLPPSTFIGLIALTVGFFLTLFARRYNPTLLLLYVGSLILMLYGTIVLVADLPRIEAGWRHIGYIEFITRNREIDPLLNAYFNWPGFFAGSALLVEAAGQENALWLGRWAPLVFDLLYLGPLLLIYRALSDDPRLVWAAAWFYFVAAWVTQDYFSPQGFALFIHLTILAVVLRWFLLPGHDFTGLRRQAARWRGASRLTDVLVKWLTVSGPPPPPTTAAQRAGLAAIVVLLCAVVVSSHQLTPFFTLFIVIGLVVLGRCRLGGLPILLCVLLGAWAAFMAFAFMQGHIDGLLENIGKVDSIMRDGVSDRLHGSSEHLFITRLRVAFTLFVFLLATAGILRRIRRGRLDVTAVVMMVAPFAVLPLQTYGGEMTLRVYFFALPAMGYLMARFFFPDSVRAASRPMRAAAVGMSLCLMLGLLLVRYGNERMDSYTGEEYEAMVYFHEATSTRPQAPRSTARQDDLPLVLLASWNVPLRFERDERFRYHVIGSLRGDGFTYLQDGDVAGALRAARLDAETEAYFISTRSQKAQLDLMAGLPPAAVEQFTQAMVTSGVAVPMFHNRDATILRLVPGAVH